jgi:hypothetical protein
MTTSQAISVPSAPISSTCSASSAHATVRTSPRSPSVGSSLHELGSARVLRLKRDGQLPMFRDMHALPPPLAKLLNTPVLRSELPAGFDHASTFPRASAPRYHILGGVAIELTGASGTAFVSYELFGTHMQAAAFARTHARAGRVQSAVIDRIAVIAAGTTRAGAVSLLRAAVAHLRHSER